MGSVYRETYTKPLPKGAEILRRKGKRVAKWKDSRGKTRTETVTTGKDGSDRILVRAKTYTAKYRDGTGVIRKESTGCREKDAALRVLSNLERRAELVKAKVITPEEDAVADHQEVPLAEHFDAYLVKLESEGASPDHRGNVRRCLDRLAKECRFSTLGDLRRDALERWLVQQTRADMGARTKNLHRASLVAFCNWCVATDRLISNPFSTVKKSNEGVDRRRERRALSAEELALLFDAAQRRPLDLGEANSAKNYFHGA